MNGIDIRKEIDNNYKIIREALTKSVLDNTIHKILQRNTELRKECPHFFKNGICQFCDIGEDELDENFKER